MQEKSLTQANFLVKRIIQESGKKQSDIAQALGVSYVTVNRWVKGGRNISPEHFAALCAYLGVENASSDTELSKVKELTQMQEKSEPSAEEWKRRALVAEAKLKNLQEACNAMGQHVQALGCTVQSFGRIISE